ncbi:6915_t:CDS:2 [Dentiscutata erythropus]|uniref:Peroxidase n=1 Tax=Dentiscutata erythropus TaxID=1348616 RepID=A0A9N9BDU4_9GLOM|nr:6915_t:CDS:2 [Dentiscutata erythropus]
MTTGNYDVVRDDIKSILSQPGYDDGSIGPVLVRLAWHASGTYDKVTKTGGSDGATMRYAIEANDPANAGLAYARDFLEPIKEKHPWISYGDLWTLAGVVSIEAMGGPIVPWKPGRKDKLESAVPPNGRLPDAEKGADHIREVFYRMGFTDREIVALIGAHCLGRCHGDRSGYEGAWTYTPIRFNNQFYVMLTKQNWHEKKLDNGLIQYADDKDKLMMLPADMAFLHDPQFKEVVQIYAKDKQTFFNDFAAAFGKLIELGVNREEEESKL